MRLILSTRMAGAFGILTVGLALAMPSLSEAADPGAAHGKATHATKKRSKKQTAAKYELLTHLRWGSFRRFSRKEQVKLLDAYREFAESWSSVSEYASAEEKSRAMDALKRMQDAFLMLREAQAAEQDPPADVADDKHGEDPGFDCMYGGWPSMTRVVKVDGTEKRLCQNPAKGNPDYAAEAKACTAGQLACNPALFGDGICAPQGTREERDSTYRNCARESKNKGYTLEKLAERIANDKSGRLAKLFDQVTSVAHEICVDNPASFQRNNGMCQSLVTRVKSVYDLYAKGGAAQRSPDAQLASSQTVQASAETGTTDDAAPSGTAPVRPQAGGADQQRLESQIHVGQSIHCLHAVDRFVSNGKVAYPKNMVAVPGINARRPGALVFMTDDKGVQEKGYFCPGFKPDPNGFFVEFFADPAGKLDPKVMEKCADALTPEARVYLAQSVLTASNMMVRSLTPEISDEHLKAGLKEELKRDPNAAEIAAARKEIDKEILEFKTTELPKAIPIVKGILGSCQKIEGEPRAKPVFEKFFEIVSVAEKESAALAGKVKVPTGAAAPAPAGAKAD